MDSARDFNNFQVGDGLEADGKYFRILEKTTYLCTDCACSWGSWCEAMKDNSHYIIQDQQTMKVHRVTAGYIWNKYQNYEINEY